MVDKLAVLKDNFETRTVTKIVDGKEVKEIVPRFKKGRKFPIVTMDMFWLRPDEIGGFAADMGPMEYMRLTYPDGTKTKYFDLFEFEDE